jgi:hypothetical protein
MVTNRAGQGRATAAGGWARCHFYLKTGGPASNQIKIQFKKKIFFIIEHLKKTRIFLKKKIETK